MNKDIEFRAMAMPRRFEQPDPPIKVVERNLKVPPELQIVGVENDNDVETITFEIPRMFDGNIDLSAFEIKVNWENALKAKDSNSTEVEVQEQTILAKWKVPRELCIKEGSVSVALDAFDGVRRWGTTIAKMQVLKGIVVNPDIAVKYPDVISDLQKRVKKLEDGGGSGYTLPQATESVLGGVKAIAKTNETVPVAIDGQGKLFVPKVGETDYSKLKNKPKINGIELKGNVTTEQLGIKNGVDGYTPVRGVDYFTQEDINGFVQAVIEGIPKWDGGRF